MFCQKVALLAKCHLWRIFKKTHIPMHHHIHVSWVASQRKAGYVIAICLMWWTGIDSLPRPHSWGIIETDVDKYWPRLSVIFWLGEKNQLLSDCSRACWQIGWPMHKKECHIIIWQELNHLSPNRVWSVPQGQTFLIPFPNLKAYQNEDLAIGCGGLLHDS